MGLYDKLILPRLIHFACGLEPAMRQRARVVPRAEGRVLEIGIGSGLNLPYYDAARVSAVIGLDPSEEIARMARRAAARVAVPVELVEAHGEEIPLDRDSVDTVLTTYTLCTIAAPETALREMIRVLRPGGRLIFCEHGIAPDAAVRRWQARLNPVWSRLGGGCRLDRDIPGLIERAGFTLDDAAADYIRGWRPVSFNYWGSAVPARASGRR